MDRPGRGSRRHACFLGLLLRKCDDWQPPMLLVPDHRYCNVGNEVKLRADHFRTHLHFFRFACTVLSWGATEAYNCFSARQVYTILGAELVRTQSV